MWRFINKLPSCPQQFSPGARIASSCMKCTSIEVAHAQDYVPSGSHVLDPDGTVGQGPQNAGIPRYELGMQFDLGYWNSVDPGLAAGVRFHYNFNGHVALDSELTSRRQDLQVNGLLGLRAGQRVGNSGLFVLGRAGFLHYGGANGFSYLSRNTVPAFDVGLTMEHYSNPMVLRFELGELIVPYGNAIVLPPPPPAVVFPPGPPTRLGTRVTTKVGLGVAFRF